MKQKVFISYSHTDENYMTQLSNHMSMMKREGLIDEWNDRKLIPGQEWDKEISENLISATIIILLISSDFLGSEYCYDIEMNKAMELHNSKKATVLPIIVRSCDWSRTLFSKLQAMPKDAVPIKKWDDEDDAWLDVSKGLRKTINCFLPEAHINKNNDEFSKLAVIPEFESWLDDTEIRLTHRKVSTVLLSDIYVQPDIKSPTESKKNTVQIQPALTLISKKSRYMIFGEEQQGKTSFLKFAFKESYKKGLTPLFINGADINNSDRKKVLTKAAKKQYEEMLDIENSDLLILIDDFCRVRLNGKARGRLLNQLNKKYNHIIITSNDTFSYIVPEIQELDEYNLLYQFV